MISPEQFRERLKSAGWTQAALAKKLGRAPSWLSRKIAGARNMNCDELLKICAVTGISPTELLGFSEPELAPESADKHTSATGRAFYDICRVVLLTGLRRSEVLNMRWPDIIDDELRVRGKGGKVRMVPLNAEARTILDKRPVLTAYVFDIPNRNTAGVLRRVTETITRRAKVPFHIHLLRHVFASRLLASGVDIVTVGDLLGHSSAMVTLLYTHSSAARKRDAVDTLLTHA